MFLNPKRIAQSIVFLVATGTLFGGNDKNYTYLALGDSLAYGLDVTLLPAPNQPLPPPSVFIGYPETVAAWEHLLTSKKEVNASCPGETSSSFITPGAPDNGCNGLGPQGQPPFKSWIGLHTTYPGTQLSFAKSQLLENQHINLVTLGIGANDLLLVLEHCAADPNPPVCVGAHIPGLFQTYAQNLDTILNTIRNGAHYNGNLVLVLYYSPDPLLDQIAQGLNATTVAVATPYHALFADGYKAFKLASANFGGDACKAGLLIRLDATHCDIHPTPPGRDILAAIVLAAIGDGEGNQQGSQGENQHGNH